jgi:dTDP-4-dehydrorhamnose reductase
VTVLVIGRSGQVGRALAKRAEARGIRAELIGRPDLDLERLDDVAAALRAYRPEVIINAAGYTTVDKAEDEPERAHRVNAEGAAAIALAAAEIGAALIHVSTDYVFAGDKPAPYVEDDPTAPTSVYGASKLRGEILVREANAAAIILRTSWVYDASGTNFVRTMLRLAKLQDAVDVVSDQQGSPTFASDLADVILDISSAPPKSGIYHCTGSGTATWADFAEQIFAFAELKGGPTADVQHVSSEAFMTRAKRPANSRLDCAKLASVYGVRMREWPSALADCITEIAETGWSVE